MGRKTVYISDLSGEPIGEGKLATITITYDDPGMRQIVLDVGADEIEELASKGRPARLPEPRRADRDGERSLRAL